MINVEKTSYTLRYGFGLIIPEGVFGPFVRSRFKSPSITSKLQGSTEYSLEHKIYCKVDIRGTERGMRPVVVLC